MTNSAMQNSPDTPNEAALAIIGMAGRFPGAASIDTFWQNLAGGVKSIRRFSDEELLAAGVQPELLKQANYVKAGTVLDNVANFDAAFFGYTPREAEIMDPQHRLFLECAWEALEDAAYDAQHYDGLIGVFAGSGRSSYLFNNVYPNTEVIERVGTLQVELANERDALATMVSYKLNLKGPSFAVQTFCSTSLVALHLACQSLLSFECDIALAGGVAIDIPQEHGYLYEEGGILSPDGECRTFDAMAGGSVMGNGVGVVTLKRLDDAVKDGDHIYAVIRGSAMNNDGGTRVSYTAPSLNGQKEVIAEALGNAGVAADTIQYIEAHGTATMLGDAVELAAMIKAFEVETQKKQFCAIGSVKPNIGHLDRASGITGLIKTVLALQQKKIPPSLNFQRASGDIDLDNSPFYVNTTLAEWTKKETPRRAAVSSFGLGGTNVHVVLEESPAFKVHPSERSHQLLLLSAKSEKALQSATTNVGEYLQKHKELSLADVAYTLSVGRSMFNHRRIVVGTDSNDVVTVLETVDGNRTSSQHQTYQNRPVAFLFSDPDDVQPSVVCELYRNEPVFRETIERCNGFLKTSLNWHGLDMLLSSDQDNTHTIYARNASASHSEVTQSSGKTGMLPPALFAFEYALAQLLQHWGIAPQAMLGYGLGEYVVACLCHVFSLEDALLLVARQSQLLHALPRRIAFHPPQTPYISPLTGTWITAEQATDSDYWNRQRSQEGQLTQGIACLMQKEDRVLLEVGSSQALCTLIKQQGFSNQDHIQRVIPLLLTVHEPQSVYAGLLMQLGNLWLSGVPVNWQNFYASERRRRVPLPTYPFERQRYWIEAPRKPSQLPPQSFPPTEVEWKKLDCADWFYLPSWQKTSLPVETTSSSISRQTAPVLVFMDTEGVAQGVVQHLRQSGYRVVVVRKGEQFVQQDDADFTLRPDTSSDYVALCSTLAEQNMLPELVLHCWSVTLGAAQEQGPLYFQERQAEGFYSLLFLARALAKHIHTTHVRIAVISTGIQAVNGNERLQPEKATILGACKVIAQEYMNIVCQSIDVLLPDSDDNAVDEGQLAEDITRECTAVPADRLVAYRDQGRWIQEYEATRLAPPDSGTHPLRKQGVYMITGGLGKVGLVLASYLAETVQAKLVLVGQTGIPAQGAWQEWLETHAENDRMSERIRQVQTLETKGAEVLVVQADVANLAQMELALQQTYTTFGRLHGVIHAAGISTDAASSTIDALNSTVCEKQFRPKVHGVFTLEQVLQNQPLDFCIVFSSLSTVLGGLGFAAYAGANLFMDAYVRKHNQRSATPWTCVHWDSWLVRTQDHGVLGATIAAYSMHPAEGVDAFLRILASGHRHVINSVGDLQARIRQWVLLEALQESASSGSQVCIAKDTAYRPIHGGYEQKLLHIWQEALGIEHVGLYDNFFELGGNSLIGLQVISRIRKAFHAQIPVIALFEAPTVSAMTRYLQPAPADISSKEDLADSLAQRRARARHTQAQDGIAIIGMSGRFPGATTIEQFWQNLRNGVESIASISDEELLAAGVSPTLLSNPDYVKARPLLADVDQFDAAFFGYSPREAELMDPQHRLFMECSWEALEHAGYDPSRYDGLIGVFAGANVSSYLHSLITQPEIVEAMTNVVNGYQVSIGTDKDALTTAVSYKLNLKGPSFAVQTFCSTSLVAAHLACQSLLMGESDMALAGGVSVHVPVKEGHLYQPGGMESPDGHCRTFDADAKGGMFGDGVGIVVLKRLSEALEDGDTIYAVIKGSAVNNDGSLKVSYTAPSVIGQAKVVTAALAHAGVNAESISYVEAHGTATELGDPIEVASLTKAFRSQTTRTTYCAIGSVKTNVGHLDRAAGVTGLIKIAQALQHEEIPASLHFQTPNPAIDFAHSPFYVNTHLSPWKRTITPRRAGINSLGMGGTNVHMIVEEAPEQVASDSSCSWQLLLLSARTESALDTMAVNLAQYLQQHTEVPLADVAYTLQVGRKRFAHRQMLLCRDHEEAIGLLSHASSQPAARYTEPQVDRSVIFLFPGVGELRIEWAQELYVQEATFRYWVDRCCALLQPELSLNLRQILFPAAVMRTNEHAAKEVRTAVEALAEPFTQTILTQPALFVIEYALAQLLMQWGLQPQAMLGYSLGEYVAACLAGVFSLKDALSLIARRARLIQEMPPGMMLAVSLPATSVAPYIHDPICLAAINGPTTSILSGPREAMLALKQQFERANIVAMRVKTTHAFHSTMLEPLREPLTAFVQQLRLHSPKIPYISNITGTWITAEQATDPTYWGNHMCQPVQLMQGLQCLLQETDSLLLEVGPGQALSTYAKQHADCTRERAMQIFATSPSLYDAQTDTSCLLTALGKLWLAGVNVNWHGFYTNQHRRRIPLPTYPFERQHYWLSASSVSRTHALPASSSASTREIAAEIPDLRDWFYIPSWKQLPLDQPLLKREESAFQCWLLFLDTCGVGEALRQRLLRSNQKVITLKAGKALTKDGESAYTIRPGVSADYEAVLRELRNKGTVPHHIVHFWSVSTDAADDGVQIMPEDCHAGLLEQGFYSLVTLAQVLGDLGMDTCQISIVSTNMQDVTGDECISPEKATLIGPCKVIPQEYPRIRCRSIDILLQQTGSRQEENLIEQLMQELMAESPTVMVALRGRHRWIQTFESMHLERQLANSPLRDRGVYMITGGLGGIGMALAEYLASTLQARLVLTARSALPAREQWPSLLALSEEGSCLQSQIRKVQSLEALGAEVLIMQADVCDERRMQDIVQQTLSRFGMLHGVFHLAGVPATGLMQLKDVETLASVLAPKVQGVRVLESVLQHVVLDFLVLFSSLSSATGGGPGQVDYCAANAFLDAYAHKYSSKHGRTISIDWGEWRWNAWDAGLAGYPEEARHYFQERRQTFGIGFAEGFEALLHILQSTLLHVVVSTEDFPAMVEGSKTFSIATILQEIATIRQSQAPITTLYASPKSGNTYAPPESELEHELVLLWGELLGIAQVGIHDNFFELGGHSLMGTQLVARLRTIFQVDIRLATLFEAPTIAELAIALELLLIEQIETLDDAQLHEVGNAY